MDSSELLASLRILAHVIRADSRIRAEEKLVFEALGADAIHLRTQDLLREPSDLDEQIKLVKSPELRERTLELAVALAAVDGVCSEEEEVVLRRIREAFGLSHRSLLETEESLWQLRSRELRRGVAEAETSFLHRVHDKADHGSLSQERYEQEAVALSRVKEALRDAFLKTIPSA